MNRFALEAPSERPNKQRPPWKTLGLAAVGFAALFLLAEMAWRVFAPTSAEDTMRAEQAETILGYLRPCAVSVREGGEVVLVGVRREYTGGDFRLTRRPAAGVLRIAFVGESTGAMLGGALHELVAERMPGRIEVMTCADAGSSLEHAERRALEVLEYGPDVLVVSFGHNLMSFYPMNEWLLRAGVLLRNSQLMAGLSKHFVSTPRPPLRAERLRRFETWLRQLAETTRRRGVKLAVTTMAANLWFAPAVSAEALFDKAFLAARMSYARGKKDLAIERLDTLLGKRSEPYWHFTLATWLAERGDMRGAVAHLRVAIDDESLETDRRFSAVNEVIRRVAREEKLLLRDTEAELEAISRPGLPGWDMFSDHCHLLPVYRRQEAAAILRMSVDERLPDALEEGDMHEPPSIRGSLIGLIQVLQTRGGLLERQRFLRSITSLVEYWLRKDPLIAEREVGEVIDGDVLAAVGSPEHRGEILASIAQAYWMAARQTEAMALNERARRTGGPTPWTQLGLFYLRRDDDTSASDAFAHALEIAPRPDAAFYLAESKARR